MLLVMTCTAVLGTLPDDRSASVALVQMQATTKRLTRGGDKATEPIGHCTDVDGWQNALTTGSHLNCSDYAEKFCFAGAPHPGSEWTLGPHYNWPEVNCCECGRNTDCHDTPGWTNHPRLLRTCRHYRAKFCSDGKMKSEFAWAFGARWNFPEKNCCACGADAHEEEPPEEYVELVGKCEDYRDKRYWCPADEPDCGGLQETSRVDLAAASSLEGCHKKCDSIVRCVGIAFGNSAGDDAPKHCITFMNQCTDSNRMVDKTHGYIYHFKRQSPYMHLNGQCKETGDLHPSLWCNATDTDPECATDEVSASSPSACQSKCDSINAAGGGCSAFSWGSASEDQPERCKTLEGKCRDTNDGVTNGYFSARKRYQQVHGHCKTYRSVITWCPETHESCSGVSSQPAAEAARSPEYCRQKCDSMGSSCQAYAWGDDGGQASYRCKTFSGWCTDSDDDEDFGYMFEKKIFIPYEDMNGHCLGFTNRAVYCTSADTAAEKADCIGDEAETPDDAATTTAVNCQKKCNEIGSNCKGVAWKAGRCVAYLGACVDSMTTTTGGFEWYRPPTF